MLIFAILTGIAFFGISIYTAQDNETRVASDLGTFEVANEGLTEEQLASAIYADVGLDESTFVPATLSDEWTVMVVDKEKTS